MYNEIPSGFPAKGEGQHTPFKLLNRIRPGRALTLSRVQVDRHSLSFGLSDAPPDEGRACPGALVSRVGSEGLHLIKVVSCQAKVLASNPLSTRACLRW